MAKKRAYLRNTVKGTRRGQKWPEQTRTAALCDLLVGNNICAVARRHGVPESTLRSWLAATKRTGQEGEKSLFERAREEQLRAVGHLAAAGARASVEYVRRRLESNARDAAIYEEARQLLDEADGIRAAEGDECLMFAQAPAEMDEERRRQLLEAMDRHRPMNDHAAANYLRALTGTVGRTAEIMAADLRRQTEKDGGGIEFVLSGGLEELGG